MMDGGHPTRGEDRWLVGCLSCRSRPMQVRTLVGKHRGSPECLALTTRRRLREAGWISVPRVKGTVQLLALCGLPHVYALTGEEADPEDATSDAVIYVERLWVPRDVTVMVLFAKEISGNLNERIAAVRMFLDYPEVFAAYQADALIENNDDVRWLRRRVKRYYAEVGMGARKKPKKRVIEKPPVPSTRTGHVPNAVVVERSMLVPRYATREANPNKMEPERFSSLVKMIKEVGFLQPILASPLEGSPDKFLIEDGHHRWWAAEEAGATHVSIVPWTTADTEQQAILAGIGMNRNRGDLDLSATGDLLKQVLDANPLPMAEVSTLTGFSEEELNTLLAAMEETTAEDILDDAQGVTVDVDDAPEKIFLLEISFADKASYRTARKKLKKMGGGDLALGLMRALGEQEDGDDE